VDRLPNDDDLKPTYSINKLTKYILHLLTTAVKSQLLYSQVQIAIQLLSVKDLTLDVVWTAIPGPFDRLRLCWCTVF